jgi:iron(III) transport system permease protein
VVAVVAVHAMPLAYVVIAAALAARVEPDLERAARAAGATAVEAFRTVTVPLLRPALAGAATVVFITAVNAFGIPVLLGTPAGFATMTTRIYQDLVLAADPAVFTRAVVMAAGLAMTSVALVAVVERLGAVRGQVTRTASPVGATVPPTRTGRLPAVGLWTYLLLTAGLPLAALGLTALTRAVGLPAVPGNWTLANFAEALAGPGAAALRNSATLAVAAATAVVALGGLLTALRRRRSGRALGTAAVLTFAVPGSALAVAVLLAYGPFLRDTLLLILMAYLAKFWALGHRPIAGAADGLPPELRWAARASGASPAATLRTVVIPLLRPAIAGAWMLVALFAFHELTMSILLYGPGTPTLAVAVLNIQQLGDVTVTSALAVLLTGIVLGGAVMLWLLRRGAARLGRAE